MILLNFTCFSTGFIPFVITSRC